MANESSGKKALKAGLGYTVGNMLVKGLSFLAIPLFARLMTVEDFGIYSTFSSYVMIMTVLAGFTLHTSVRNAKLDYVDLTGSYCSSVTLLVIGNSLLLLGLSLVFAAPLARSLSLEQPYLPALIVLESFGMAMLTFYNSVLSVDYKYKEYLVLSLVYAVAGIGGSVLLILTLCRGQGYLGRILGTLIPAVLVGIYVVIRLWRKDRPRISREYWRYGMAISLPTVPHGLSQLLLNQFDRIMIKSIIGSTEAGLYSFAYNVGMIFQVITNSMDTAWAPWFFEKMKAKEYPAIRRAASAYVVFVSIGAMALALISPEVILIAGGSKYSDSRYVTMPIVLSMYYAFLYTLPSSVEYYYKKTKLIALGTMLAAGMNILLNAVFIPAFGYVAAAYTTVACYLLYYLLHVALSWWVHKGMVYDPPAVPLAGDRVGGVAGDGGPDGPVLDPDGTAGGPSGRVRAVGSPPPGPGGPDPCGVPPEIGLKSGQNPGFCGTSRPVPGRKYKRSYEITDRSEISGGTDASANAGGSSEHSQEIGRHLPGAGTAILPVLWYPHRGHPPQGLHSLG